MKLEAAKDLRNGLYAGHGKVLQRLKKYRHHSGRVYTITGFSNTSVDETEKFPHMVEYVGNINGNRWTRPAREFVVKFEEIVDDT